MQKHKHKTDFQAVWIMITNHLFSEYLVVEWDFLDKQEWYGTNTVVLRLFYLEFYQKSEVTTIFGEEDEVSTSPLELQKSCM